MNLSLKKETSNRATLQTQIDKLLPAIQSNKKRSTIENKKNLNLKKNE